jgi:hypothetical protein
MRGGAPMQATRSLSMFLIGAAAVQLRIADAWWRADAGCVSVVAGGEPDPAAAISPPAAAFRIRDGAALHSGEPDPRICERRFAAAEVSSYREFRENRRCRRRFAACICARIRGSCICDHRHVSAVQKCDRGNSSGQVESTSRSRQHAQRVSHTSVVRLKFENDGSRRVITRIYSTGCQLSETRFGKIHVIKTMDK